MKIAKYESWIVLAIILVTVMANLSAFLYRSLTTPPGRVFIGTQYYSDDYAVYVADIKQGQKSGWQVADKFTSEAHPAALIHEEYLLWGKLTGLLKIPPVLSYHLARLVFGLIFLFLIYGLLLVLLPRVSEAALRIGSLFLICFGNGFLSPKSGFKEVFLSWLTDVDPTQRFGPVPHYLIGFIGFLGILICFYMLTGKPANRKLLAGLIFFGLLAGFCLPTILVLALTILLFYGLLNFNQRGKIIPLIAVLILINIPSLLYYRSILKISPWSHILAMESTNRGPFTISTYLLALGPVSLLCFLGLKAIRAKKKAVLFLFSWLAASLLWSFKLADIFKLNPTRFLQSPVYLPMSILTVLGLNELIKIKKKLILAVGLIFLVSLPASLVSLKNQYRMYADYSSLIYPESYFIEAFSFLEANTRPQEAVISYYLAGNLTPFLAGNTTYLGHLQETLNYYQKVEQAKIFFSGQLTQEQAKVFLNLNRIKLVFWGLQEKAAGGKIDKYPFLTPIFDNGPIMILRMIDV